MKRTCEACGRPYEGSSRSKYCTRPGCKRTRARGRKRSERGQNNVVNLPAPERTEGSVEKATRAELDLADKLETSKGQSALVLARQLDDDEAGDTGSSKAAVAKQLQVLMTELLKDVKVAADPLDELRSRRERKLRGA